MYYFLTTKGLAHQCSEEMGQFLFKFQTPVLIVDKVRFMGTARTVQFVKQCFIDNVAQCKHDMGLESTNPNCVPERMQRTIEMHQQIADNIEVYAKTALEREYIVRCV